MKTTGCMAAVLQRSNKKGGRVIWCSGTIAQGAIVASSIKSRPDWGHLDLRLKLPTVVLLLIIWRIKPVVVLHHISPSCLPSLCRSVQLRSWLMLPPG